MLASDKPKHDDEDITEHDDDDGGNLVLVEAPHCGQAEENQSLNKELKQNNLPEQSEEKAGDEDED